MLKKSNGSDVGSRQVDPISPVNASIHTIFFQVNNNNLRLHFVPGDGTNGYKVNILDVSLRVAIVELNPSVIMAHVQGNDDIYPFANATWRPIRYPRDNLHQGHRLIAGRVSSSAFNGKHKSNPFNLQTFD